MELIDSKDLRWKHFTGSDNFDYPIDYWAALLGARADGYVVRRAGSYAHKSPGDVHMEKGRQSR